MIMNEIQDEKLQAAPTEAESEIEGLRRVIKRLRAEDGCPWDREQTHETLKGDLIEESCEVICGINVYKETGDASNMMEELGDLLLQVVMHAEIASEEGLFDFDDVARCVREKMIRRHPHVFGNVSAETTEQVLKNWAEIKKEEKSGKEWMDDSLPEAFEESLELLIKKRDKKLAKLKAEKQR